MRYRAQEKAYLTELMNNPKTKAELRLEACERHAKVVYNRFRDGKYADYSFRDFVIAVKEHSDTIDEWFDRDGWKR